MRTRLFPMIRTLALPAAVSLAFQLLAAVPAMAQDPVKVDAKHYKVEFENDQVRVLRITYGPHEKSVMHSHPSSVAVFLTDGSTKFTLADGKTLNSDVKAGTVVWEAGGKHLPENLGDKPFELILVELKGKHAAAKSK
jgi:quercetin dioxygenase-like cupin family protein